MLSRSFDCKFVELCSWLQNAMQLALTNQSKIVDVLTDQEQSQK